VGRVRIFVIADIVDVLSAHGITYANWDYKAQNEFGLRVEEGLPDEELNRK